MKRIEESAKIDKKRTGDTERDKVKIEGKGIGNRRQEVHHHLHQRFQAPQDPLQEAVQEVDYLFCTNILILLMYSR